MEIKCRGGGLSDHNGAWQLLHMCISAGICSGQFLESCQWHKVPLVDYPPSLQFEMAMGPTSCIWSFVTTMSINCWFKVEVTTLMYPLQHG